MKQPKRQESELGGLPPELLVDGQEAGKSLKVDDQPLDNLGDTDTDTDTDTDGDDSDQGPDKETLGDGLVSVVVIKGNTIRHDGRDFTENRTLTLSTEDAQRLIGLGVVADVEQLRKQALNRAAPAVSVQSGE
ncbi:hypothetical protein KGP26_07585 [Serratia sp. JSRIV002]|uniref:hypothetical protein n=1 Tax=Serratia sp. JSRIV002 TaxID=2831894 RepID=UPI001CBAAC5E|nr:hypothetical protein [Serratia sp. JSRIV002]UAN52914.1 hypothetical protein KGP26_07585 [Serratia sp. JSRIV002]